jgi:HK97 gp10 family phage protein
MSMLRFDMSGDPAVAAMFRDLSGAETKKAVRGAGRKAWRRVLTTAKSNAPTETGSLKRALGVKQKTIRSAIITKVGAVRGAKARSQRNAARLARRGQGALSRRAARRNPANYIHLVERGTRAHTIRRRGGGRVQHPGAKPSHFLRRAFDAGVQVTPGVFRTALLDLLRKATTKARAGGAR